eukprot:1956212-Rhodomonas_salina.8
MRAGHLATIVSETAQAKLSYYMAAEGLESTAWTDAHRHAHTETGTQRHRDAQTDRHTQTSYYMLRASNTLPGYLLSTHAHTDTRTHAHTHTNLHSCFALSSAGLSYATGVCSYAPAMRCPVLSSAMLLPGWAVAHSYGYVRPYPPTRCPVLGPAIGANARPPIVLPMSDTDIVTFPYRPLLCLWSDGSTGTKRPPIALRPCYALSSTDGVYAPARHRPRLGWYCALSSYAGPTRCAVLT